MGGGGIKRGVILGETNERSEYPTERPVTVQDFCATTSEHALGIPLNLEYRSAENRPITVVKGGQPIADLIGMKAWLLLLPALTQQPLSRRRSARKDVRPIFEQNCVGCHSHGFLYKPALSGEPRARFV